jgi:hypothetical protein
MQFCFVIKNDYRDCPPLHRLMTRLGENGYSVDVFCLGSSGSTNNLPINPGTVRIVTVPSATGIARHFRPLVEVPRLSKALAEVDCSYDICIVFDPYALEAIRQSKIANLVPIIYYSLELWDEKRFWPQRLCERLGRGIVSGVICPQEERLSYLKDTMQFHKSGMVFPNVTIDYLSNQSTTHIHRVTRPPTNFVYLGGLQLRKRAILELVEVFGNRVENARLVIYGRANARDKKHLMKKLVSVRCPQNITINEFLPYGEHFKSVREWHIGVMLYVNGSLNYRYCAPNKLYEYSMLSLPILASNQTHLINDIERNGFGLCVDPESVNSIEKGVRKLTQLEDFDKLGQNARDWYLQHQYDSYYEKFIEYCKHEVL